MIAFLNEYTISQGITELFKSVILDVYSNDTAKHKDFQATLANGLPSILQKLLALES